MWSAHPKPARSGDRARDPRKASLLARKAPFLGFGERAVSARQLYMYAMHN